MIGALLTDTLAGPVLGAAPTSKFLVLWALFILVMMAVAYATAALQTVLGAAGTLVVVIVFVIFGAPALGGTVRPWYSPISGGNRVYLPAGAGTTVVRNTIYFGGNDIGLSLFVLGAYLVAGAELWCSSADGARRPPPRRSSRRPLRQPRWSRQTPQDR